MEIRFEEGMIGVPGARRFEVLSRPDYPVLILRCLDIAGLSFHVTNPVLADPGYSPPLDRRVEEAIGLREGDPCLLLAVTILEGESAVANLRAPLVLNVRTCRATQMILEDRSYPLRAPVRLRA